MKFLVDAQLPPRLAEWLVDQGHTALHVAELGLLAATDREIWAAAEANEQVLVTKDRDFIEWALEPAASVRVVWVRIGNLGNAALIGRLAPVWADVISSLQSEARVVEVGRP